MDDSYDQLQKAEAVIGAVKSLVLAHSRLYPNHLEQVEFCKGLILLFEDDENIDLLDCCHTSDAFSDAYRSLYQGDDYDRICNAAEASYFFHAAGG